MERVQSVAAVEGGEGVPSLASLEGAALGPPPLAELASAARNPPGSQGREALARLHAALGALAPTEENGKLLVRLLDERAFDGLVGDDGTETRELAVEALLELGYPWALQVHPEELSWFRGRREGRARTRRVMILLGILVAELGVGAALSLFL